MAITESELALAGIAGTLLGTVIGGLIAARVQRMTTADTLEAQRMLADDARRDDRADEIARENRAHRRNAYIAALGHIGEVEGSTALVGVMRALPRNGSPYEDASWLAWRSVAYEPILHLRGTASAYGSDAFIEQVSKVASAMDHLLVDVQSVLDDALDSEADQPPAAALGGRSVLRQWPDLTQPVSEACWDLRVLIRAELNLSA